MLPSYEPRQAQLDLLELLIRAFNEDALVMAEAGTGVGKSFAYLLPAMRFALENKDKVVISTATITLQQQLFEKDIPLVASALGVSGGQIKMVLMKGRGNYVCLRRLDEALREPPFDEKELEEIKRISEWADGILKNGAKSCGSASGGRTEMPFMPSDGAWALICSESDLCMGQRCPFQSACFVFALRREAESAHIIVVNHHLLFADLAARFQGAGYEASVVLPPFKRLIIDEAHKIEDAATSFFSAEFSRVGIFRHLGRLYHKRRGNSRGLLVRLCSLLPPGGDPLDALVAALEKIRASMEELDERALSVCGLEGMFRLSPAMDGAFLQSSLFPHLLALRKNILAFSCMVRDITGSLDEDEHADPAVWETKMIQKRLESAGDICAAFCEYRMHPDEVLWMERNGQRGSSPFAVFTRSPLDLAPRLRDSVFMPNKTVACVSATLTVNNDFTFWASRSGVNVENRPLLPGLFPSPFPYSSSVLLAVPTDAPLPDEEGFQNFVNAAVSRLIAVAGGSALVLFTSYQSLNSAWENAAHELRGEGIQCYKQGDDDRSRLLQNFLHDTRSVLFATDSFWEGIDAPGDTLRLVIICRLPFRSPGDPLFEARREAVEERGGNPFMELSLPQAVMKFRQGFGRLIRRGSDSGVVAVLDGRLLKKRYGELFLRSLPETKTCFNTFDVILREMENFLY
ncbi:MAG: ATP-dependent DNA helicase DinG [Treponema sp.]|nr:ATP-dependent DNA helicase DinG [Treponema sp.]